MGKIKNILKSAQQTQQRMGKENPRALSKSSMFETRDREELDQQIPLKVGDHQFRIFTSMFDDPERRECPEWESIPEQYKTSDNKAVDRFYDMFFNGFKPSEIVIKQYPEGVDRKVYERSVINTLHALMRSHNYSQSLKVATFAWCLDEWTVV